MGCGLKIKKKKKEIIQDLNDINRITTSTHFEKRAGLLINFSYESMSKKFYTLLVIF
jgi:hypothetical protein